MEVLEMKPSPLQDKPVLLTVEPFLQPLKEIFFGGEPGVVAHTFNPSTWEAEADGYLWVQDQAGPQSQLQDSQGYTERPCDFFRRKLLSYAFLF